MKVYLRMFAFGVIFIIVKCEQPCRLIDYWEPVQGLFRTNIFELSANPPEFIKFNNSVLLTQAIKRFMLEYRHKRKDLLHRGSLVLRQTSLSIFCNLAFVY